MTRGKKFYDNLDYMEVCAGVPDMLKVIKGKIPKIFVDSCVKIRQVMSIEDDTLCICLCIANTKGEKEFKIGFSHDSILRLT
jgi:hypothetical protein